MPGFIRLWLCLSTDSFVFCYESPTGTQQSRGNGMCFWRIKWAFPQKRHLCRHHLYKTPHTLSFHFESLRLVETGLFLCRGTSSISTEVEVDQLWPMITRTAGEMWSTFSAFRKHGWGHGNLFWLLLYDREMISLYLMEDFLMDSSIC